MNSTQQFNITWHYHINKETYTIGFLTFDVNSNTWNFKYNLGEIGRAVSLGFTGFPEFTDWEMEYSSTQLFRTFQSRIPSPNRKDILKKHNMVEYSEIELLKSIPYLITDNIGIIYQKQPLDWTK